MIQIHTFVVDNIKNDQNKMCYISVVLIYYCVLLLQCWFELIFKLALYIQIKYVLVIDYRMGIACNILPTHKASVCDTNNIIGSTFSKSIIDIFL